MEKIIFKYSCLLLIVISIISCKSNSPTEVINKSSDNEIMPLKVGNQWIIKESNPNSLTQFVYDTISVIRDTVLDNQQWFISYSGLGHGRPIYKNTVNGLLEYDSNGAVIRLKYPVAGGTTYNFNDQIVKVLSVNDTIDVPAGKFVCYHYDFGLMEYWYSPKIGLVKSQEYVEYQSGIRKIINISELKSYKIK